MTNTNADAAQPRGFDELLIHAESLALGIARMMTQLAHLAEWQTDPTPDADPNKKVLGGSLVERTQAQEGVAHTIANIHRELSQYYTALTLTHADLAEAKDVAVTDAITATQQAARTDEAPDPVTEMKTDKADDVLGVQPTSVS